jgi:hypothetical protein
MTTLKTDTKYNFTTAENDLLSWDWISHDFLSYKPTGQQIYQMEWYIWRNSTPITDPTIIAAVKDFWAELQKRQEAKPEPKHNDSQPEKHGYGWCDKCQSYCYGDCEA